MATKRKSKKNIGEKVGCFLLNMGAAHLVDEGLHILNKQDFMQSKEPDAEGKTPFNLKKAIVNGSITIGSSVGAILIENEEVCAAMKGAAVAGSLHTKEHLIQEFSESSRQIGAYQSMYEESTTEDMGNIPLGNIQLGSSREVETVQSADDLEI